MNGSDGDQGVYDGTKHEPTFSKEGVESVGGTWLKATDKVMVNVSGVADEPLWVDPNEVAAVGVYGKNNSLLVLRNSGNQLVAKGTHPNEVLGMLSGLWDDVSEEAATPGANVNWSRG